MGRSKNAGCLIAAGMLGLFALLLVACCVGGYFVSEQNKAAALAEIERANGLWDEKQYEQATAIYKDKYTYAEGEQKAHVLNCIIWFELQQKNDAEAERWIRRALDDDVTVTVEGADDVVAAITAEVEAERQRRAEEKRKRVEEERRIAEIKEREGTLDGARVMAPEFVKRHLSYPDDAEFPHISRDDCGPTVPIFGQRHWVVEGKVKAKNAFGAALTYRFKVQLYHAGKDVWRAKAVVIDGEQAYRESDEMTRLFTESPNASETADKSTSDPTPIEPTEPTEPIATATTTEPSEPKSEAEKPLRTWTDKTGEHTVSATFTGYTSGKVKLKKEDGSVITVDYDTLSAADQEYIRGFR